MSSGECEMDERMMSVIRECNIGYDIFKQEEGAYDVGWKPLYANTTTDPQTLSLYK